MPSKGSEQAMTATDAASLAPPNAVTSHPVMSHEMPPHEPGSGASQQTLELQTLMPPQTLEHQIRESEPQIESGASPPKRRRLGPE